ITYLHRHTPLDLDEQPSVFFFNDTAPTEIYTLSLHDALPIFDHDARGDEHLPTPRRHVLVGEVARVGVLERTPRPQEDAAPAHRSEEHTSELQSRGHLVCRLLLEKKKQDVYQT